MSCGALLPPRPRCHRRAGPRSPGPAPPGQRLVITGHGDEVGRGSSRPHTLAACVLPPARKPRPLRSPTAFSIHGKQTWVARGGVPQGLGQQRPPKSRRPRASGRALIWDRARERPRGETVLDAGRRLGRKSKQRSPCQRKRDVDGRERPRRTAAENTRRRARAARPPRWGGGAEEPALGPSEGAVPASTSTSAALSHVVRGVCHGSPRTLVPVQAHAHELTEPRCPLRPRPAGTRWAGRPHRLVPAPPAPCTQ